MSSGLFRRKTINGDPGMGLIPALAFLFIPLVIVAGILWKMPMSPGGPDAENAKSDDPAGPVNVSALARAARSFSSVQEEKKERSELTVSDRKSEDDLRSADIKAPPTDPFQTLAPEPSPSTTENRPTEGKTIEEASDALSDSIATPPPEQSAPKPKKHSGEQGVPAVTEDPDVLEGAPSVDGNVPLPDEMDSTNSANKHPENDDALIYRVPKKPKPAPSVKALKPSESLLLQRGATFRVYFLEAVNSLDTDAMVVMGVAENVVFNHKVVIPFGTRLVGRPGTRGARDRMHVTVEALLYPDGREVPISAVVKGMDEQSGVPAYYVPRPSLVTMAPYFESFTALYLGTLADSGGTTSISVAGIPITTEKAPSSVRTAMITEASKMITEQMQAQITELNQRYAPYLIILPGTEAQIQMRTALNLSVALEQADNKLIGDARLPTPAIESAAQIVPEAVRAIKAVSSPAEVEKSASDYARKSTSMLNESR